MPISPSDLVASVRSVANEFPTRVYDNGTSSCQYTPTVMVADGSESRCIIGEAAFRLGLSLPQFGGSINAVLANAEWCSPATPFERAWLRLVQHLQDTRLLPWSQCINSADYIQGAIFFSLPSTD